MIDLKAAPRVALIADTFYEVNGVARTCREWEAFARRRRLPFFCARWGRRITPAAKTAGAAPAKAGGAILHEDGPVWTMDLAHTRLAYRIDSDLYFDFYPVSVLKCLAGELTRFEPDIIHVTSPGDMGILGLVLAARLRKPLALSWHTNVHEFAGRRAAKMLSWLPAGLCRRMARWVEHFVMGRVCWFYRHGDVEFAPNPELMRMVGSRTGKPTFPMGRGVDTTLFSPERRDRTDHELVLGFVGRLMAEKNLRLLPRVADALAAVGITRFRFQITGAGSEREWLDCHLPRAEFTGVLTGEVLARAYANMDIFVFPSRTDSFGNAVQEALASGVPAVVTDAGGPRFIVSHGSNGLVAGSDEEFCAWVVALARDESLRRKMGCVARRSMIQKSWDRVFEEVYEGYASALQPV
jgi:glycosyltransferase involved in cell wall biosynthesis